jgi:hypothetical protein
MRACTCVITDNLARLNRATYGAVEFNGLNADWHTTRVSPAEGLLYE